MVNWTDLRLILAIAKAGSLRGAAKQLGINHSTVYRRLSEVERHLGTHLFDRLPGGAYGLTAIGERVVLAAGRMEEEALALDRDLTGRDLALSGRLRVTSSETLAYQLLIQHIAAFRRHHPGIVIELAIDNRVLSLSRREADVALRPMRPTEGDLWGRKLSNVAWTVYGARSYMEKAPPVAGVRDLTAHPLIGWEEAVIALGAASWLSATVPDAAIVYRSNSLVNQLIAARAGIGLAVLPCYLGDADDDLMRVLPEPVPQLARELWIVTHSDLRKTARVKAFFDIVGEGLTRQRSLLEGARPLQARSAQG